MTQTPPELDAWAETLDKIEKRIAALRSSGELRSKIPTPIQFDEGRPDRNAQLEGILTLASWAGVLLGGLGALIALVWTTGPVLWIFAGIAGISLLYVVFEVSRNSRSAGPWYEDSEPAVGCLLLSHDGLFEEGTSILAGGMLVTFDPGLARDLTKLSSIASGIQDAHEAAGGAAPGYRDAADWIQENVVRPTFRRTQLSESIAGNRSTYLVCLGYDQKAMPHGKIDRNIWPVFGRKSSDEPVVLVPHELWYKGDAEVDQMMRGE